MQPACPRVREIVVTASSELEAIKHTISFPAVMKVVGPLHKTDVGGVFLNVKSIEEMRTLFARLLQIDQAKRVLIQPMIGGTELFIGVKRESNFGHIILCGLGGIFVEVLNDFSSCLCPVSKTESMTMIRRLKAYRIIQGIRGRGGVNEELFSEIIQRISALVSAAPEIAEMDINPLMGSLQLITAVDSRIRIEK